VHPLRSGVPRTSAPPFAASAANLQQTRTRGRGIRRLSRNAPAISRKNSAVRHGNPLHQRLWPLPGIWEQTGNFQAAVFRIPAGQIRIRLSPKHPARLVAQNGQRAGVDTGKWAETRSARRRHASCSTKEGAGSAMSAEHRSRCDWKLVLRLKCVIAARRYDIGGQVIALDAPGHQYRPFSRAAEALKTPSAPILPVNVVANRGT
jgi:hypothetical protein